MQNNLISKYSQPYSAVTNNNCSDESFRNAFQIDISKIFLLIFCSFIGIILLTIIASLFVKTTVADMNSVIQNLEVINAIKVSVYSILISIPITGILSIPMAFIITRTKGWFAKLLDIISVTPILIPPSITGLALLMTFGRVGILSDFLDYFHIEVAFTFAAVVLTQIFITLPIFVQIMKNAFNSISKDIIEASVIYGADDKSLLFNIFLPLSFKPICTAIVLCILRAAGEFGATMMFAGNLTGKTQTITTAIFTFAQQNTSEALALAALMIMFFVLPFGFLKFILK